MFERFTNRAREAIHAAKFEARAFDASEIAPEHMLLGLLRTEGIAARALGELGLAYDVARDVVAATPRVSGGSTGKLSFGTEAKHVLERSLREALNLGHNYIGTEHLLLALLAEPAGVHASILIEHAQGFDTVRAKVFEAIGQVAATGTEGAARTLIGRAADVMPRCPSCDSALSFRARTEQATTETGEQNEVTVIYCASCGHVFSVTPRA